MIQHQLVRSNRCIVASAVRKECLQRHGVIQKQRQQSKICIPRRCLFGLSTIVISKILTRSNAIAKTQIEDLIPEGFDFGVVKDRTLAYEFLYPKQDLAGKPLSITFYRKPTQYALAAPQSVTGRQRIVCGLGALLAGVVVTVSVGPPSSELTEVNISDWTPALVANDVLADKSIARTTGVGRIPIATVENAKSEQRDKNTYWIYESILAGSATIANKSRETYRHSLSVSSARVASSGMPYLYTLTLSCPQDAWDDLGPLFELSATSFRLAPETRDYIAPDKGIFGVF